MKWGWVKLCVFIHVTDMRYIIPTYTCTSQFLICFEAWGKLAQNWLVCVPLEIHLEPIAQRENCAVPNKKLFGSMVHHKHIKNTDVHTCTCIKGYCTPLYMYMYMSFFVFSFASGVFLSFFLSFFLSISRYHVHTCIKGYCTPLYMYMYIHV